MTHNHSLKRAERLLSTDRHHRHSQLRLFEDLVIFRILRERGKLREPGTHSTWLRVRGGKEISRVFVRLTRICRKVIPYSVKVDALTACHEPFRIRSMKVEMPN